MGLARGGTPERTLHGGFEEFTDQALIWDAPGGGFGLYGRQQSLGDTHVDAGRLWGGFPGEGAELGGVEGGEVLGEEGFGGGVGEVVGDGFQSAKPCLSQRSKASCFVGSHGNIPRSCHVWGRFFIFPRANTRPFRG